MIYVQQKLGVTERRACAALGQSRGLQRRKPTRSDDEEALTADIIKLARQYGRYGYKRITALLRVAGWRVNHKRVERIWRQEALKVPQKHKKKGRLYLNDGSCIRLRPCWPNHVWAYDFVAERLKDGTKIRTLTVIDEYTRECLSLRTGYALEASKIFERIAKEGRKYGAFLMVASQRPSELSRTVLSQCSNFVVHRIQNPEDLSHIRQMTPFISEAVLRRLPSLPKQHALVFGNAVNLPTTFKVRSADPIPYSNDTKICDLWFRDSNTLKTITPTPVPL